MPTPEQQDRWRTNTAPGGYVAYPLSDADARVLDHIAIELYEANPHDPREGIRSSLYPSRLAALRYLVREYADAHPETKRSRVPLRAGLPHPRERLARFWKLEACWRRAKHADTDAVPPIPPWK